MREESLAKNEELFRKVNERIETISQAVADVGGTHARFALAEIEGGRVISLALYVQACGFVTRVV